jgi:hypothetical protein
MRKVFTRENAAYWIGAIIVMFLICFFLLYFAQIPTALTSSGIVSIISTIMGMLLTVFVTSILLKQQSETEGEKDKNLKVFEKQQEVYHQFLEKLKTIIQDGEIRIASKKEDGSIDTTIDDLKDLIFQLAFFGKDYPNNYRAKDIRLERRI